MKNEPSILTRRGFLRTMGLIVGAVVVAPAVLAKDKEPQGPKMYDPSKVEIFIGDQRVTDFVCAVDFSDGESYTISTSWDATASNPIADIDAMIHQMRREVYQRAPGENDETFRRRIKRDLETTEDP